jgi:hypothetical protein
MDSGSGTGPEKDAEERTDPALAAGFTRELKAFVAAAGTRRAMPTSTYVGRPGSASIQLPATDDTSVWPDLVQRALEGLRDTRAACAWVTRTGGTGLTDADAAWFAAARQGFGRHGLVLPAFAVVTRTAWVDLVSGEQRVWRRVRATRVRREQS